MLHPTIHSPFIPARLREIRNSLPESFTLDENTAGHWPSSDSAQRPGTSHSWRLKSHSQSQPSYCLPHKCTAGPLSCWQMECSAPHFQTSRKSDILQMKRERENLNIVRICPKVLEGTFALAVSPDPTWCTWHWNRLEQAAALQNSRSSLARNSPCLHNCTTLHPNILNQAELQRCIKGVPQRLFTWTNINNWYITSHYLTPKII